MKYRDCLDQLEQLGNEVLTMRPGLESMRSLLRAMGDPQLSYPGVLVAGTNGKGSISRFIAAVASSCGLKAGRFSSPHLVTVRERIRCNDHLISRAAFAESFERVQQAARSGRLPRSPTYFETVCAIALDHFAREGIDLAVLEIGLGGRLDSTNAVEPVLSVLGPIGLDHQSRLGNTVQEIAAEKAGILRPSTPVVSAPQPPEAEGVIREVARISRAPLCLIDPDRVRTRHLEEGRYEVTYGDIRAGLQVVGRHQGVNAAVAIESVRRLRKPGWHFSTRCVEQGLSLVRPFGVLQRLGRNPDVFVDGGHNPDAARTVARFLRSHTREPRRLILSMMRDKDVGAVSRILTPLFDGIDLFEMNSLRAASAAQLQDAFPAGRLVPDVKRALGEARRQAATVLIFGSFHLAGMILADPEVSGDRAD